MANLTATTITGNLDVTGGGVISGDGSGLSGVDPFASGTKMVFYQASAPTGWTQDTAAALANTALSVVTGTGGGTGGSDSFYSVFTGTKNTNIGSATVSLSGTVGSTTLTTPQIPSHNHPVTAANPSTFGSFDNPATQATATPSTTGNAGGGGGHSHPFSGSGSLGGTISVPAMDIKYANVIIAAKD